MVDMPAEDREQISLQLDQFTDDDVLYELMFTVIRTHEEGTAPFLMRLITEINARDA